MFWNAAALTNFANPGPASSDAWGSDLVDQSLTTLWYPARWNSISDDELVFLLPSLSRWQANKPAATDAECVGPVDYLTRVLRARAVSAATLISRRSAPASRLSTGQALDMLMSAGILTTLPAHEFERLGIVVGQGVPSRLLQADSGRYELPDWLVVELTAVAHLDRMLADAIAVSAGDGPHRAASKGCSRSLADVVASTINARLNGAYVYPEYAFAQELLTVAALLGHLVNGRAVYMPPDLAQCLADVLSDQRSAADDWCVPILIAYAELAGGSGHLLGRVRRAAAARRPYLVKPRMAVTPKDFGRTTWNARLLQNIRPEQFWSTSRAA